MKLISLSCPYCHAPMQINSELEQGMCNYCGYKFLIDKEEIRIKLSDLDYEKIGKAAEHARLDKEEKIADETARKISEIYNAISKCEKISESIIDTEYKINEIGMELNKKKNLNKFFGTKQGAWFVYVVISIMIFTALYNIVSRRAGLGALEGTIIVSIIIFLAYHIAAFYLRKTTPLVEKEWNELLYQKDSYEREANRLKRDADIGFVPINYRHKDALRFMNEALQVRRAKNLNEAIRQYEEEKERAKLRQLQRQQMEAQRKVMEEQEKAAIAQRKAADARRHAEIVEGVVMTGVMIKAGKGIVKEIFKSLK